MRRFIGSALAVALAAATLLVASGATRGSTTWIPTETLVGTWPMLPAVDSPILFTASILPDEVGAHIPTGTVTFWDTSANLLCQADVRSDTGDDTAGWASCEAAFGTVGAHGYLGTYSGDDLYDRSSGSWSVVVKYGASVTLVGVPNPSDVGQPVTFSATLAPVDPLHAPPPSTTPTGTVTFAVDVPEDSSRQHEVPVDAAGAASWTSTDLAPGAHQIYATYSGDGIFAPTWVKQAHTVAGPTGPTATPPVAALRHGVKLKGSKLKVALSWSCTEAGSGMAGGRYDLARSIDGGLSWTLVSSMSAPGKKLAVAPTGTVQFRARCVDSVGNVGAWAYGPTLAPRLVQQGARSVSYHKTWTKARSSRYSNGSVKYARARYAKATYTFTGSSISFVTTKALSRGRVKVYIDGIRVAKLDTYRARSTFRVQLWSKTWSASASHTIKLVVLHRPSGHPRVDLDAFAVLK